MDAAFDALRAQVGGDREPTAVLIANDDERIQMTPADGMHVLQDGAANTPPPSTAILPIAATEQINLWVVRLEDVVYAAENCEYGRQLETGTIKHTNLTGGTAAYAGGEIVFRDAHTIVINGKSGRYPVRDENELRQVAIAFKRSGYHVWSMGFDNEAGRPFPFVGVEPQWVA